MQSQDCEPMPYALCPIPLSMTFTPFHIRCTTCEAKLAVRSPALLGQLLACPKCGSMVQIPNQPPQTPPKPEPPDESSVVIIPPTLPIAPVAEAPPVLSTNPVTEEPEPLIQKRPRHASEKSTQIILSIILLSIVFLLAALYITVLLRPAAENQEPPLPPVIVEPPENPLDEKNPEDIEKPEIPETSEFDDPEDDLEEEPNPVVIAQEEEEVEEIIDDEPLILPPVEPEPFVPQPIREQVVIDVSERLQLPIAGLKAERTTLFDAATVLADYAGVPLTWDVSGMRLFGISLDKPLRLDFEEATVGDMLALLLSQNQLAMLIEHGQIFIYPIAAADPTLHEVRYDIADLLRDSNARLVEMIPHLIAPLSWQSQGATCQLDGDGTVLVVNQTEINHREIARFFEMVREARKIPLLSTAGKSPQETERTLRELFPERYCEATLDKPLTLHYVTPTPLADVFRILGPALNLRFLVNHRTLNEAQIPFTELKGTVHVEKGTVREAVQQLLHSVELVELTYRIVDWNTVEIITRDAAFLPEYGTLESHYYGAVLREQTELTPEEMIAMLKNTVEPDSWAESTSGGGAVFLDHVSETFFIRQSHPVQQIVYVWLKE